MATDTKIQWCDHTFNPWMGCTKVNAGCTNCYAETLMDTRWGKVQWGPSGTRVMTSPSNWRLPLKWDREAEAAGERRRVFCASLADVFEDWTGPILDSEGNALFIEPNSGNLYNREIHEGCNHLTMNDLRRQLFALIDVTPHLDWLLLTKRPENVRRMWPSNSKERTAELWGKPSGVPGGLNAGLARPNVWLLTSVSDQATADAMVPELLKLRDLVPVLGLSCEPLLGPVDLRAAGAMMAATCFCDPDCHERTGSHGAIDWVICGGESGHGARPCNLAWIRSIVEQCKAAGTACFVKQLGAHVRADIGGRDGFEWPEGTMLDRDPIDENDNARFALRDPKGGDWTEWPEDVQVRQFPPPYRSGFMKRPIRSRRDAKG